MLVEKNFFNLLYLGTKQRRAERNAALRQRRSFDQALERSVKQQPRQTKQLISTLLGHGARATRATQPRVKIAMSVFTPSGSRAVKLKLSRT